MEMNEKKSCPVCAEEIAENVEKDNLLIILLL